MAYKHLTSSLLITGKSPKEDYIDLFQETLNQQFYNSSDWWTVQEETSQGSKTYTNIDVRISHLINAETGLKMGDDWKTVLFKEIDHAIEVGKQYIFDENTWLTINTEKIKNLTGTCTIRRCNNTLRWVEESTGIYYEEPCCIEYMVKEPRDYATGGSPFITPGGFLHITLQFNERTNKIKQNQRFMFGNPQHWTCYKVIGTGINDFRNETTYDNGSAKLLILDLVANFVNDELDDIVNGIADTKTNLYQISLNIPSASGKVGDTVQLVANVLYNGNTTDRTLVWETSDSKVATVDANGLVTLKKIGTCIITAGIENNSANATCAIVVNTSPVSVEEVRISPDKNYVLEGSTDTFAVYLFTNNVQETDVFNITCDGNGIPQKHYVFQQIDGNHFSIKNNLRFLTTALTITCVSGTNTKTIDINLRGGWLNDHT